MIDRRRLSELLTKVPTPPEDSLPPPATDPDCDSFEKRSGIRLPDDVRDWLKLTNGPCVGPGGLYGIRPPRRHLDMEAIIALFPSWKAHQWLPIAGDGCGNYYVIPTQQEY